MTQLRRVLARRLARHATDETLADAQRNLERVLSRLAEARLLDDRRFAEGFAAAARRRGGSALAIRRKLAARGVAEQLTTSSLEGLREEGLDDLAAAKVYAKKRRLHARDLSDPKERQKALASLARQGFSFEVARRALEEE